MPMNRVLFVTEIAFLQRHSDGALLAYRFPNQACLKLQDMSLLLLPVDVPG
jgi:hypothetical protein